MSVSQTLAGWWAAVVLTIVFVAPFFVRGGYHQPQRQQKSVAQPSAGRPVTVEVGFVAPESKDSDQPLMPLGQLPASEDVSEAIHQSADYLVKVTQPDGSFVYRKSLNREVRYPHRYNMLRHAGTMYSLVQYQEWSPNEDVQNALVLQADYLKQYVRSIDFESEAAAVWSIPEVTNNTSHPKAKLGGAGLALVALVGVERIAPGQTSIDELRRLGEFILFMQKNDGSFYSQYTRGVRDDSFVSLYYPGEAALGLMMLYEVDPDPRWLNAAVDAMNYLARSRQGRSQVEADHWALIATERLLRSGAFDDSSREGLAEGEHDRFSRERLLAHARQVCESILAGQPRMEPGDDTYGAFSPDGRTCPTATRLEGLIAALRFLPPSDADLRGRMETSIHAGIDFLLRAQVQSTRMGGAMPRAIRPRPDADADFNRRAKEVRIDYVQHAMSAWIEYQTAGN